MKFKIGDKVRVVDKGIWGPSHIGEVGVVQSITHHYIFPYRVKFSSVIRDFTGRDLEKVK